MATSTKAKVSTKKASTKKDAPKKTKVADAASAGSEIVEAATPNWFNLMNQALNEPGELREARKFFKSYSLSNRWLASTQLREQGIPLQPINTYLQWQALGRCVRKGEKATVALNKPIKIKVKKDAEREDDEEKEFAYTKFILIKRWFHLGQTDGEIFEHPDPTDDEWNLKSAMSILEIKETPFDLLLGGDTEEGKASGRSISIFPFTFDPEFIRIREMSKILLDHTAANLPKSVPESIELRNLEAEAAAYLCAATIGLPGLESARARIQSLTSAKSVIEIPERIWSRAFSAADKLINAGYC